MALAKFFVENVLFFAILGFSVAAWISGVRSIIIMRDCHAMIAELYEWHAPDGRGEQDWRTKRGGQPRAVVETEAPEMIRETAKA